MQLSDLSPEALSAGDFVELLHYFDGTRRIVLDTAARASAQPVDAFSTSAYLRRWLSQNQAS